MTGTAAAACVLLAALVVAWPDRPWRRWRRLAWAGRGRAWVPSGWSARRLAGRLWTPDAPWTAGALCAVSGLLLGGPVAGLVAAVYGALVVWSVGRRRRQRAATRAREQALDALNGLAADLRAGLPPSPSALSAVDAAGGTAGRASAVATLAAVTGAPLADLLDRIEVDARAADRARALAGAQQAGMRATAYLLAALPVAGLALGHGVGADPVGVLLGTPIGVGCAVAALVLQLAGLAWSGRLARAGTAATAVLPHMAAVGGRP